jgi:hypothetical protein
MANKNFMLQYGDIICIISPNNPSLNNKFFFIKFINLSKINLISPELITTLDINEETGELMNETIDNIVLHHREKSPSFVIQNDITVGKHIAITFGGDFTSIIRNGLITNI